MYFLVDVLSILKEGLDVVEMCLDDFLIFFVISLLNCFLKFGNMRPYMRGFTAPPNLQNIAGKFCN